MITKAPPEILSPEDLAYMSTLNERERRRFLATKAVDLKAQGFSYCKVSKIMGTNTHTLQNGRQELLSGEGPGDGRIAERVLAGRACFPSIRSGRRPSCRLSNRIRQASRRMRMWYRSP